MKESKFNFFLDSGAHSLYNKYVRTTEGTRETHNFKFYESDKFWNYVDNYANFIKKHIDSIDIYVNVDVIFNPELTWKVQKYLEDQHSLNPLPVFHFGEDIKWLKKYMDEYDYIGVGGLGQEVTKEKYYHFGDEVFSLVCGTSDKLPKVKIHGFAMTSLDLMKRYPWYSVDSTTWIMQAVMGSFMMPWWRNNKWDYSSTPVRIRCSIRSYVNNHYAHLSSLKKKIIDRYLNLYGMKMGKSKIDREGNEEIIERGACNTYYDRMRLNIFYLKELMNRLSYPRPFKKSRKRGLL